MMSTSLISFRAKAEGIMMKTTYFPSKKSYSWVPVGDSVCWRQPPWLCRASYDTLSHSGEPEQD